MVLWSPRGACDNIFVFFFSFDLSQRESTVLHLNLVTITAHNAFNRDTIGSIIMFSSRGQTYSSKVQEEINTNPQGGEGGKLHGVKASLK